MSFTPTLIGRYANGQPEPVSRTTPLPVDTRPAEPLLVSTITADTTARDLLASTNADSPTIDRASEFKQLIWTGYKTGTADITYTILARSTDLSGNPLGNNWYQAATGTISGAANSWFRVDITQGNWDQYRIQVTSSASQQVFSKVMGVR